MASTSEELSSQAELLRDIIGGLVKLREKGKGTGRGPGTKIEVAHLKKSGSKLLGHVHPAVSPARKAAAASGINLYLEGGPDEMDSEFKSVAG